MIAAGTPAKVLRELTDEEKEWKAAGNRDYHNLAVRCHESLQEVDALTELDAPLPRIRMALTCVLLWVSIAHVHCGG